MAGTLAVTAAIYFVEGEKTGYLPATTIILVLLAIGVALVPFLRQGRVEAERPVCESLSAR